jgi:vancomycin resistance protein YoaR
MHPSRRLRLVALVALGAAGVLVTAAYALDMATHRGEVARNVRVAGTDFSGLGERELAAALRRVDARYAAASVRITSPGGRFSLKASELGLRVDREASVDQALHAGRRGWIGARLWGWASSFVFGDRSAAVRVKLDRATTARILNEKDPGPHTPAVEPNIKAGESGFETVRGLVGRGIDPDDLVQAVSEAAATGPDIRVEVGRGRIEPRFTEGDARRVAEEADRLLRAPLAVRVGPLDGELPVSALQSFAEARPVDSRLEFGLDPEKLQADLAKRFARVGEPVVETRFVVSGGGVQIVPGRTGTICCEPASAGLVEGAVRRRPAQAVELPLERQEPKLTPEAAAQLGIKELVGSFTTRHPSGQPRVANIHRIADLVRGQVIQPGATFSVNGFVGRRTPARGFVSAPVIQEGLFAEDIGGGISQFATTLFNAAFLAGLEFPEYQSHSIYISRYPYGREATLAYPHPDLRIRNSTPYGVLIWPTYSSTGITVHLWSTKHWSVSQTGQTKSPQGVCTRVRTERKRTAPDGTSKTDAVFATYRPEEGVNCSGQRTATTTTAKAATTTVKPAPAATTTTKPATPPPPPPPPTTATSAPPPPP